MQQHSIFTSGPNRAALVGCICLLTTLFADAQKMASYDSNYIRTYPTLVTARAFLSQKYSSIRIQEPSTSPALLYRPNTPLAGGIGATYRAVTINIAIGALKDKDKGATHTFDLLSHVYTRKWIGDIYGQFYKGYHIADKGYAASDANSYYVRPDIKLSVIGLAAYRVLNDRQFSYRAAFLQNEWQKRSAGSFLFGGEIYHGVIRGDSALVPASLNGRYTQAGVRKLRFVEFGPGAGYAYTLVLQQHFFIMASANVNADVNYSKEFTESSWDDKWSFAPNISFRSAIGYNSDNWSLAASWIGANLFVNATGERDDYFIRPGNYRLTYVHRFAPGKGLRKFLKLVDWIPYL